MNKTYLELFAGTGIGGIALEEAGYENVGYSEFDKYAIQNYDANFPGRTNFGDITKIDEKALPDFDMIIGGSPCTQISMMSKTWSEDRKVKGLKGEDSCLFYDYIRILNEKLPSQFIFENVKNLISSNNGEDFAIVKAAFEENYNIKVQTLNTSDYGLPHTRRRLYIVGQRKDLGEFNFDFPTKIISKLTMQDLLDYIVDDKYYLTQKMYDCIMSPGTKGWISGKMEINLPIARTLTSTMHKMHRADTDNYISTEYRPEGKTNLRRLIPRECARLQGLSDDYKIVVSDTQAYRLMGNAMSLNVVRAIVKQLNNNVTK
jgi:DNA (cytosine-5)-methyltransferase 1